MMISSMLFCYTCTALHCTYHIHTHTHTHRNLDCLYRLLHNCPIAGINDCIRQQFYTGKQTPQAVSQNSSGPYQADHHYNAVLQLHFVEK